jgi:RNA polymerase sigma factor (sigma-70 family)
LVTSIFRYEPQNQGDCFMPGASSRDVLRHLNTLFHCGTTGQLRDAELIEQFAASHGETAQAAFAALVERHGTMVMGVCRRVLGNREAAEDAFQATFLVLARKAASVARREQLANWLYGVALRAALEARGRAVRRQAREKRHSKMVPVEMPDPFDSSELRVVLDEELARLPERFRTAIVLCELEGLSRRQAAAQLGISEGTLSSRLARAKIRLRDRLTRRGVTLSAAALGSFLAQDALAVMVPPTLADSTIQLATLISSGSSLAGIVSTPVATLTEGVLKAMLFAKVKSAFLGIATVALLSTGMGVLAQSGPSTGPAPPDRLKAVEQKLDRLLEVLGKSNRPVSPVGMPPPGPATVPPVAPTAIAPPAPPTPPADNLPVSAPVPPAVPPRAHSPNRFEPDVAPDPLIATTPPQLQGRGRAGARSFGGQAQSLAGRIDALEQRLGDFERRLGALERRLQQVPGGAATSGLPRAGAARDMTSDFVRRGISAAAPGDAFPDRPSAYASDASPDRPAAGTRRVAPPAPPATDTRNAISADPADVPRPAPPATPSASDEPAGGVPSSDLFSPTAPDTQPPPPSSDVPPTDTPPSDTPR